MPSKTRRTIDAAGNLITVSDGGLPTTSIPTTSTSTADTSSSSSSWASRGQGVLSTLQSIPTITVFGHPVPARQFWIGLAAVFFMFGLRTVFTLMMLNSLYNLYRRTSGSTGSGSGVTASAGTWGNIGQGTSLGSSGGGGGGGRTTGGGNSSNIRGISDLPSDPKGG